MTLSVYEKNFADSKAEQQPTKVGKEIFKQAHKQ
jgi:hypothetical protein